MTPIEKAAMAICAQEPGCKIGGVSPDSDNTLGREPLWKCYIPHARSCIESLREPSEEMMSVLARYCADERGNPDETLARGLWETAIDAVLNPQPKEGTYALEKVAPSDHLSGACATDSGSRETIPYGRPA